VVGGALRGMGHSLASMLIIVTNMCVLRIALLALFSERFHTVRSMAWVYPITWITTSLCFIAAFAVVMRKSLADCGGKG
jgi:Na+-driven multidrug efflux pump